MRTKEEIEKSKRLEVAYSMKNYYKKRLRKMKGDLIGDKTTFYVGAICTYDVTTRIDEMTVTRRWRGGGGAATHTPKSYLNNVFVSRMRLGVRVITG